MNVFRFSLAVCLALCGCVGNGSSTTLGGGQTGQETNRLCDVLEEQPIAAEEVVAGFSFSAGELLAPWTEAKEVQARVEGSSETTSLLFRLEELAEAGLVLEKRGPSEGDAGETTNERAVLCEDRLRLQQGFVLDGDSYLTLENEATLYIERDGRFHFSFATARGEVEGSASPSELWLENRDSVELIFDVNGETKGDSAADQTLNGDLYWRGTQSDSAPDDPEATVSVSDDPEAEFQIEVGEG